MGKQVEAVCDECGEYNTCEAANDQIRVGEGLNIYCVTCDDHTEHTVTEIL